LGTINRRLLENLIKAGAFDSFMPDRQQQLDALPQALQHGERRQQDTALGLHALFGEDEDEEDGGSGPALDTTVPPVPPATEGELDASRNAGFEKEALGFFLTTHPLRKYEAELADYGTQTSAMLREAGGYGRDRGSKVTLAGIAVQHKLYRTKRGERMAFVTLEDGYGQVEVTLFPDVLLASRHLLDQGQPVVIEGELEESEDTLKVTAEKVVALDDFRATMCRWVAIHGTLPEDAVPRLAAILAMHRGQSRVALVLELELARIDCVLGEEFSVRPGDRLLEQLQALPGVHKVLFTRTTFA
jgi:DNA polymerase-3 subunit alpha